MTDPSPADQRWLDENARLARRIQELERELAEHRQAAPAHSGDGATRQQADAALERMGALAKIGYWEYGLDDARTFWSNEVIRILELSDPACSLDCVLGLFAGESAHIMRRAVALAVDEGKSFTRDAEIVTASGTRKWVRAQGRVSPDADGRSRRLFGIIQDISEIRLLDRVTQESEMTLSQVEQITHIGHWSVNLLDGSFYHSDEIKRIFGYEPSEYSLSVEEAINAYHPDDRAEVIRLFTRAAETGEGYEFDLRVIQPSGRTRNVHSIGHAERNAEGRVSRVYGVFQDITEITQAERRYRDLFDQASEGLLLMTTDGRISQVNRAFAEMHGCTVDELRGMRVQDLDALRERTFDDRADIIGRIQAGEVVRFEVDHLHKDGHVFPLSVTASVVMLAGQPFWMAFHQDITARKRAEQEKALLEAQLQQAQKMESVGRLAGGVAHDFNNMLGVILGHTEMALDEVDPAQPLHASLHEIHLAAKRSTELTRQLLAFARKQTVTPCVLELNPIVSGALNMLRRLIGENVRLTWDPGRNTWPVKMDPSQLEQILANLCVNARDAIDGVGTITISASNVTLGEADARTLPGTQPGDYVQVRVADDGCGMDSETVSHIFEPFFTTKGVGQGTGLGLASVYGAVKQNGGSLQVRSTPGVGTVFTIYLPRTRDAAAQSGVEPSAQPAQGHETILLVEDEPGLLKLAKTGLERKGYTVLTASLPGEAIRLADAHAGRIHLLVTDVVMPEMDGRALAKRVLRSSPHTKCLFMSGYTADVIADHGVVDDGMSFIQKPFSVAALCAKVRATLDRE